MNPQDDENLEPSPAEDLDVPAAEEESPETPPARPQVGGEGRPPSLQEAIGALRPSIAPEDDLVHGNHPTGRHWLPPSERRLSSRPPDERPAEPPAAARLPVPPSAPRAEASPAAEASEPVQREGELPVPETPRPRVNRPVPVSIATLLSAKPPQPPSDEPTPTSGANPGLPSMFKRPETPPAPPPSEPPRRDAPIQAHPPTPPKSDAPIQATPPRPEPTQPDTRNSPDEADSPPGAGNPRSPEHLRKQALDLLRDLADEE